MSDPKRWSEDDSELDSDERRLLRAGLHPHVPRGAKRAVWLALGAQLPPAVAAASATGASSLTAVSLLKSAGIGLVLGATTMGAVAVVRQAPTPPPPASVAAPKPAVPAGRGHVAPSAAVLVPSSLASSRTAIPNGVAPPPRAVGEPAPPTAALSPAPSEAAFPEDGTLNAHDTENLRVRAARGLLQAGRTEEALVVLERIRRELPNGELSQEREALSIEALRLLGRTTEARKRAAAFLARHPESPHAATARRALE